MFLLCFSHLLRPLCSVRPYSTWHSPRTIEYYSWREMQFPIPLHTMHYVSKRTRAEESKGCTAAETYRRLVIFSNNLYNYSCHFVIIKGGTILACLNITFILLLARVDKSEEMWSSLKYRVSKRYLCISGSQFFMIICAVSLKPVPFSQYFIIF